MEVVRHLRPKQRLTKHNPYSSFFTLFLNNSTHLNDAEAKRYHSLISDILNVAGIFKLVKLYSFNSRIPEYFFQSVSVLCPTGSQACCLPCSLTDMKLQGSDLGKASGNNYFVFKNDVIYVNICFSGSLTQNHCFPMKEKNNHQTYYPQTP